jgi:hypothetical protein
MSTMLVELYDALKEAGASEAKARAESLVVGHDRLERIEEQTGRFPKMQDQIGHTREDIARLDQELAVANAQIDPLEWMNGIVIAGVFALIIKDFLRLTDAADGDTGTGAGLVQRRKRNVPLLVMLRLRVIVRGTVPGPQPEDDPAIQPSAGALPEAWMRGSSPRMTMRGQCRSDRALPAFAEPAAEHAGDERHEATGEDVDDREVARDQKRDQDRDRRRDAGLEDRSSRRLEADDEAADREGEKIEHRSERDLTPAQLDVLRAGRAFELRAKEEPQNQAGDQIEHDHHDHADADPLPVQRAGHFLPLRSDDDPYGTVLTACDRCVRGLAGQRRIGQVQHDLRTPPHLQRPDRQRSSAGLWSLARMSAA